MHISRIELSNFRNHQHLILDSPHNVLIIVGDNAAGKTNIIEALQLISMHESFRHPKAEELLYKNDENSSSTYIEIDLLQQEVSHTKKLILNKDKKKYYYDKKERPSKELLHIVPSVLFTPDDLQIIKGSPEQRRVLLDSIGSRLSKTFAQIRSDFSKALRHKNSLLKQDVVNDELLDSWNVHIAKLGFSLSKHRIGLCGQLLDYAKEFYHQISGGEVLEGSYQISWRKQEEAYSPQDNPSLYDYMKSHSEGGEVIFTEDYSFTEEDLYRIFTERKEEEKLARRTLIGPQKDDVSFTIQGHDARRFASQGQQRSIALALKMAEIEIIKRVSDKEPLLLLDDVMSELDGARRRFFTSLISEANQTIITTTNLGYFDEEFLQDCTVFTLQKR